MSYGYAVILGLVLMVLGFGFGSNIQRDEANVPFFIAAVLVIGALVAAWVRS